MYEGAAWTILASAKAIDNLYSHDLFSLNQHTSGQRSPLSVCAYAVGINCISLASDQTSKFFHSRESCHSMPLAITTSITGSGLGSGPYSVSRDRCVYLGSSCLDEEESLNQPRISSKAVLGVKFFFALP